MAQRNRCYSFPTLTVSTGLSKRKGLRIAERMKKNLLARNIPIDAVYLFGSLAEGKVHEWSDVDVAVVYMPFRDDQWEEHSEIASVRDDDSIPIDIVCLRKEDMENKYSTIVQEVKMHGIAV
jgi:predicted nucleotidyltransferase